MAHELWYMTHELQIGEWRNDSPHAIGGYIHVWHIPHLCILLSMDTHHVYDFIHICNTYMRIYAHLYALRTFYSHLWQMIHVLQDIYVLRMCVTFEYYLYIGTSIDVCITRHTRITHILLTFVTITHIYAHTCLVTHTSLCANVTYMCYIYICTIHTFYSHL